MPIDPQLISHGEFHVEEGIDRGRALLALADRPTAIFAGNDLQALGVYQAAREARLHIPEDLSVVGFDDLPVAQWVGPPLTTVRQPLMEMAVAAAELVARDGRRGVAGPDAGRAGHRARRPGEHRAAPRPDRRAAAGLGAVSAQAAGLSQGGRAAPRVVTQCRGPVVRMAAAPSLPAITFGPKRF